MIFVSVEPVGADGEPRVDDQSLDARAHAAAVVRDAGASEDVPPAREQRAAKNKITISLL